MSTFAVQKVKLCEVLTPVERPVSVSATKEYRLLGVRLNGAGPFLRETKLGSQIAANTLSEVRVGDFIYSRLFAWRGAFGIIRGELDSCYVSGEFPTFTPDRDRIDPEFLRYWFQLPGTLEMVEADCTGSTPLTRNRFKEQFFLDLAIPLPSLPMQRRVVARIGALAAQIEEARSLRQQAAEETDALSASSLIALLPSKVATMPLGDLIASNSRISYGVLVPGPDVEGGVPFVRVQDLALRDAARLPNKHIAKEVDAQYGRTRLTGGEILVGVVGSIGKVGIAPRSWAGANIARAVCRIVPGAQVDRDYLALVLSAQPSQVYFRKSTRTLAQPTLNVAHLAQTPIPLPPLTEQNRIVSELDTLQAEVDALKGLQAETAAELDAMLPAILDRAFKGEL